MIKQTLAKLCLWGSIACLLGFPVAVTAYRWELWSLGQSFLLIQTTFFIGLALLTLALIILLVAWLRKDPTALRTSTIAVLLLLIPSIALSLQVIKGKSLPVIHDISTDTANPPEFDVIIALRGSASNPLSYEGASIASQQQAAYPKIQPLLTPLSTNQAFAKALLVANQLHWEVVGQNPDQGRIEAVDTTLLWGFKDDVVIRVQISESGSRLDIRSVSRVGKSDLGANAARITRFIETFKSAK